MYIYIYKSLMFLKIILFQLILNYFNITYRLNAIREICIRCPLVMNADLLQDLARYKYYKERSVMMAARSLIAVFRNSIPELLHKKDRGRPIEATITLNIPKYGQMCTNDFIPGAEVLFDNEIDKVKEISKNKIKDNVRY